MRINVRERGAIGRVTVNRRDVLRGMATAAGGLMLGYVPSFAAPAPDSPVPAAINPFEAYVAIAADGTVTVYSCQLEVGQAVYTGIATLVAEELDADWSQMHVEGIAGSEKLYGNTAYGGELQITGGSTSIPVAWERYRRAGAAARAMLINAAAKRWGVPASEIGIAKGVVSHGSRRAGFGELAADAAKMPVPADVTFKDSKEWKLIGRDNLQRVDGAAKSTGKQNFTIDVRLPGMLTATIVHPPSFGARFASMDASEARKVPGVVDIVTVPSGVAIVAKDTRAALRARQSLRITWDEKDAERRSSKEMMDEYRNLAQHGKAAVARNDGDVEAALANAAEKCSLTVEFPYLAHAPLEPLNAVARLENGVLEIWSGHQFPTLARGIGASVMGVDPEKVKLHVMMTGGSFGRRATPDADYLVDCLSILKATGAKAPIKLQWTREDDMTAGHYRPMYFHQLHGGLNAQGEIVAWKHRVVGPSILAGTDFAVMITDGVDPTSTEGASTVPYAIGNFKMDLVSPTSKVPVLWWRSVGYSHNGYATEIFVDQLARLAGRDPVEFRLSMLKDKPRHLGVLKLVAQKSGWGTPLAPGRFRGVALVESYGTYVAQVAEIRFDSDGQFKVERVWCAVDCGVPINPDAIRAQMEGGIGFGLNAVLKSAITLEAGHVRETNFDTFPLLSINEMPHVQVDIVPSAEAPSGIGETPVPPIGPAVANALFAATGKPVQLLPFSRNQFTPA